LTGSAGSNATSFTEPCTARAFSAV
jgi:hypothetical protein